MDELLKKLREQRSAAVKAFEDFASPLLGENRDLSEDEQKTYDEHRSILDRFSARIKDVEETLAEEKRQDAARQEATGNVTSVREAKTYGEGSPNSYLADFVRASNPQFKGHAGAVERLNRHNIEMAVDAQTDAKVAKHVEQQVRDMNRTDNGIEARSAVKSFMESRTGMTTGGGSGGSFVTPQYMESDYAPFNQFGRVFIDQCNKQPLPEYGVSINLPAVQAAAGVASQTEGSGVQETDPTAGYITVALSTMAGQVTVSQQLLDRAGPNFQFDKMVYDQLQREYNFVVNQFALTQALAGAGTISEANAVTPALFYSNVAAAKAAAVDSSGVVLAPTHIFATPAQWEWLASRPAADGRPAIVPSVQGPLNSWGVQGNNSIPQGSTGARILGCDVFEDGGIPLANSNTQQQVVVAHMPEVWVFEGDLVPRTIPQTFAQNLQVLLQIYAYIAVLVRYPHAVQTVTGAGYPAAPVFS